MAGTATKTIQVSGLGRSELAALRKLAKTQGMSASGYAKQLIKEGLGMEHRARIQTFDELFAPVQEQFRSNGMTEDELDKLVNQARKHHHQRLSRKKH